MEKSEPLDKKITAWLSEQGYPLEMRVARQMAKAGHLVVQSDFYRDFETGTNREIDVVSRSYSYFEPLYADTASIAELLIYCTMECKSHQQPWVVFKGQNVSLLDCEPFLKNEPAHKLFFESQKEVRAGFLHRLAASAASGATQAFAKGKDKPYEALMGAFKAAEARMISTIEQDAKRRADPRDLNIIQPTYVLPVVVTDARLFECFLSPAGEAQVREVDYAAVGFRYPRKATRSKYFESGAIIYIFKESALGRLIDGLKELDQTLNTSLEIFFESELKRRKSRQVTMKGRSP